MNTWADLRAIRQQGLKPSLPVVVTTDGKRPASLLAEEGCLVVKHQPGEQFPAELLEGLRVWLFVGNCDRSQRVQMLMASKGVKPAEFNAWCECSKRFDSSPVCCKVAHEWQ